MEHTLCIVLSIRPICLSGGTSCSIVHKVADSLEGKNLHCWSSVVFGAMCVSVPVCSVTRCPFLFDFILERGISVVNSARRGLELIIQPAHRGEVMRKIKTNKWEKDFLLLDVTMGMS